MTKSMLLMLCCFVLLCIPLAGLADHSFFPVYNVTYLKTDEGDAYSIYSPGINYTFNSKKQFGFFTSLSFLWPLRSSQNGESYKNADYYDRKIGFDLMLGAGGKVPVGERFSFVPSLGAHLNGIRLRGKSAYMDFNHLALGIGTNLQARYAVSKAMDGTIFTSASWDFLDLIHQTNKLRNGLVLTLGLGLTF
jgi:hypothetical protein